MSDVSAALVIRNKADWLSSLEGVNTIKLQSIMRGETLYKLFERFEMFLPIENEWMETQEQDLTGSVVYS